MDLLSSQLTELLQCAETSLTVAPCRSFINPGPLPAFDVCEDGGQLWVAHVQITPSWPEPSGTPNRCGTNMTARVELGVLRCAEGVLQDDGSPPLAQAITNDALQQQLDRSELLTAIECCWSVDSMDYILDLWTPIIPQGGCVGGFWSLRLRVGGCAC